MPVPNFRKSHTLVKHLNRTGGFFFQPDTMRFFNSYTQHDYIRQLPADEKGNPRYLLIVSNQFEDTPREYAVVLCKPRDGAGSSADYLTDERYSTDAEARAAADAYTA